MIIGTFIRVGILKNIGQMVLNKLKQYMLASSLGIAGILGAGTANAKELCNQKHEQICNEQTKPAYKSGLEWLIVGSELGASVFAATAIHELGHAVTATALGEAVYEIKLYPHKIGNAWAMGSTTTSRGSSKAKEIAILSGGMVATRLTSEGIDTFLNFTENHPKENLHPRAKQALAALYFINRFEGPKYILRNAIPCWLGKSGIGDPQAIVNEIVGPRYKETTQGGEKTPKPTVEEKAIYAGATALLIVDTIADWDELKDNWNRLWMIPTEKEQKKYSFHINLTDGGIYGNFAYNF